MDPDTTGLDGVTLEPIVPRWPGGGNPLDNLVVACQACNRGRSAFHCARALGRVRRRRLRGGDWPSCAWPTKAARKRVVCAPADMEFHQLCVAHARDRLLVTGVAPGSEFLMDLASGGR